MTWGNWNTGRKASALRAPAFLAACLLAWSLFAPGGALAAGNTVTINDGDLYAYIFGNYDGQGRRQVQSDPTSGPSSENNLTVTFATVNDYVVGGQAKDGTGGSYTGSPDAGANIVTIDGGSFSNSDVFGGYTGITGGNANGNTVTINALTDGTLSSVTGGASEGGNANNNTVTVDAGTIGNIKGGMSNSGTADNNIVTVNAGTIWGDISGGMSNSGTADNNIVTVNAGTTGNIMGGQGKTADSNNVTVSNGAVISGSIRGGLGQDTVTGNTVTIGASFTGSVTGDIIGGQTTGDAATDSATGNTVNINGSGGTFRRDIYGGKSFSGQGDVFTGNTLNLAAGNTLGSVYNMNTVNFTSASNAGIATLDTTATGAAGTPKVTLNTNAYNITFGGAFTGTGGIDKTGTGVLTLAGTNTYSGDTAISGGGLTVTGTLGSGNYAGAIANSGTLVFDQSAAQTLSGVISGTGSLTKTGTGTLTLNAVNTYTGMTTVRDGALVLGATGSIASNMLSLHNGTTFIDGFGLHSLNGGALNVHGHASYIGNLSAQNARLDFFVPQNMSSGSTMLAVTGTTDITGGTVNVGIEGASSPLKKGDAVTLIDSTGLLTGAPANTTANGQGMQGVTLKYAFDLTTANNKLLATVSEGGPTVNPQTKALSEGFLGGMGLVTQGADVAAGQGMTSAVSAAKSGAAGGGGGMPVAGFGALSGGFLRYNSGSHVDMHSLSLLAGLALGTDVTPGRLTLGAFFEYGNGSYNTYNSFSNAASVDGNGNTHYLGGGILGRMDFINTGPGRFYAEASGRAGNVYNKYESSDLRDANGREASYDSTSTYYGLHLGTGYIWNITDKASLDLYGKYFWTRQTGDSITLSTGDPIDFDDVYSSRLRFGSRFAYAVNEYVSPYVGAAWEHEFDGKARASTNGYDMKAPSLRGDTGIGELGLTFTPSQTLPLSFDLGVQGYVGKREGVTGSLQAKYEF
ncbi:autotransporter domain-containing protein [Desulfovibrio sp.]|uniref:autotransporter domain-containing protein n=1 Tax=Desulfovibrio sp. TaxID=885 RepID=UPI003D1210D9